MSIIFGDKKSKGEIALEFIMTAGTIAGTVTAIAIAAQNYYDAKLKQLALKEREENKDGQDD